MQRIKKTGSRNEKNKEDDFRICLTWELSNFLRFFFLFFLFDG